MKSGAPTLGGYCVLLALLPTTSLCFVTESYTKVLPSHEHHSSSPIHYRISNRQTQSRTFISPSLYSTSQSSTPSASSATSPIQQPQPSSSEEITSSEVMTPVIMRDVSTNIQVALPEGSSGSIDGRLLCSSQCAYAISQPYFRGAAFRPATVAKRLSRGVNSVLIGKTYDGITIAFRGTQSSSPLDWLQNAALFLSKEEDVILKNSEESSRSDDICVHTGFYRATKSLWKPMKSVLKDMIAECKEQGWSTNIYLTGHSKGGALATIAATLMKRDSDLPDPTYVCTFGSCKVGNSAYRDMYNQNINQTSYEAFLDLIPFLPPSSSTMEMMDESLSGMVEGMLWSETSVRKKDKYKWDYQTVGRRRYISSEYEIIDPVTKELDKERIKDIEEKTVLSLSEFKAAHCSSCADKGCRGSYFQTVASDICDMCVDDDDETD